MKKIKLYFLEMRPPFFTATIVPIILGSVMGWHHGADFSWGLFILTFAGGICLHAGVNVTNDYYDHASGNDLANTEFIRPFTGGSRMIQNGLLTPKEVLAEGFVFYALGSLIGLYLVFRCGLPILWIGLIGVATSFFYTAPPVKFVHRGIGEIFIALNFGTLMTLGAYYVQTGELSWAPVIASLPVGLLILLVLYINEFQDYNADKAVGKLHWVARMGREKASKVYGALLAATYLSVVAGVVYSAVPKWGLISLLTIPIAIKAYKTARANYDNVASLTPANAATIQLHLIVGFVLIASYLFS
ncbi:MAG: 1,4-dihydroxy-2-naphthoate octaprenyltransferase [Deltaproteobacteria bacterium]|nr:1,4-dihydroxy-2-naphthoate octaprenyltransferase [Deltaproteobacteria bacterium]MBI2341657.1 1,4-dihydroxy-2-naphthoate octaprenyltransferase [Deltaproteobacteria bacterium]